MSPGLGHLFLALLHLLHLVIEMRPGPQMTFYITWAQQKGISVLLPGGWGILSPITDFSTLHWAAHIDALSPQLLLDLAVFSKAAVPQAIPRSQSMCLLFWDLGSPSIIFLQLWIHPMAPAMFLSALDEPLCLGGRRLLLLHHCS